MDAYSDRLLLYAPRLAAAMAPNADASLEPGRVDVVEPRRAPIDGYLFVQTKCDGVECMASELGIGVQRVYGASQPVNLHVRAYVSDRDTAVVVVTEAGWSKWATRAGDERSRGSPLNSLSRLTSQLALEAHLSTALICEYSKAVRAWSGKCACSHETCFANGNSIYWMGA